MEEEKPAKRKKPNWLDFRALFAKWLVFRTQRPLAIKLTILGVLGGTLFVILIVGGIGGYLMYNYTQHNPKFCKTCHTIMIESYETWETSELLTGRPRRVTYALRVLAEGDQRS